jgi:hypothetical protein
VIPYRSWKKWGITTWLVGAAGPIVCRKLTVSILDGEACEILLLEPKEAEAKARSSLKGKGKGKASKGQASKEEVRGNDIWKAQEVPKVVTQVQPSEPVKANRLEQIEERLAAHEGKFVSLEAKMDSKFEGVSRQLAEILNAVKPTGVSDSEKEADRKRDREPSGSTPDARRKPNTS